MLRFQGGMAREGGQQSLFPKIECPIELCFEVSQHLLFEELLASELSNDFTAMPFPVGDAERFYPGEGCGVGIQ